MMLTGCRKCKILRLCREHADLDRAEIRIVDGETGSRASYLCPSAAGVLAALTRQPDIPWVVPRAKPGTRIANIDRA